MHVTASSWGLIILDTSLTVLWNQNVRIVDESISAGRRLGPLIVSLDIDCNGVVFIGSGIVSLVIFLLEHRCVSLLVQESLVHCSLSLNGCGALLADSCDLLVLLELSQDCTLLLDEISMGEWEEVHAVQSAVALILLLTLPLLVSQHAVRIVESLSLQIAIQCLVMNLLEQLLSLDL
jgi:hypothetical protein